MDPSKGVFDALRRVQSSLSLDEAFRSRTHALATEYAQQQKLAGSAVARFLDQQRSIGAVAAASSLDDRRLFGGAAVRFVKEHSATDRFVATLDKERSIAASYAKELERLTSSTKLIADMHMEELARFRGVQTYATTVIPREMQKFLDDFSGRRAIARTAELVETWPRPFQEVQRALEQFQGSISSRAAASLLRSFESASFNEALRELDASGPFDFNVDVRPQAEQSVREMVSEASGQSTPEALLSEILEAIKKIPDSRLQKVVCVVFIPLLLMLISVALAPVSDFYIKKWLEGPKQEAKKQVVEAASAAIGDLRILAEHRFVTAKTLVVRLNPSSRSPAVADLHFGQTVRVLRKQKDFTLVLWTGPGGNEQIQGWVYSRYLNRFE